MNDITRPIILSAGSHNAGTGRGCAMNVISWENGDIEITDYPACSDHVLSMVVQCANDDLAGEGGFLSPENSLRALALGHATVGTAQHGLSDVDLRETYRRVAIAMVEVALAKSTRGPFTSDLLPAIKAASTTEMLDDLIWRLTLRAHDASAEMAAEAIRVFKQQASINSAPIDPRTTEAALNKMCQVVAA